MLIKQIEAVIKQDAKRQARLNEHMEFEKDYKYIIADRKKELKRENLENEADQEVRSSQYR